MAENIVRWQDRLSRDVYNRLCECRNKKSDIKELVAKKWEWMIDMGKDKQGFTKEDALISILDHLDMNNQFIDLTQEEWDRLKK